MENLVFAIGGKECYIYNSPKQYAQKGLPTELSKIWQNVSDVICAAFGPKEDSYLLAYINKSKEFRLCWGDGLPKPLVSWLVDTEKNELKRDQRLRVALGPDDSFFAWDSKSIRWSNIPPEFEEEIQEWLSPTGWLKGPPRIVALGGNGSYFALSEYGSIVMSSLKPQGLWNQLLKYSEEDGFSWGKIKHVTLSAFDDTSFLIIKEDTAYSYDLPDGCLTPAFFTVIDSLADEETQKFRQKRRKDAEAEEEAKKRKEKESNEYEDRQQRARAAEERATKAREEALRGELPGIYSIWKRECDKRFSGQALLTVFPSVPRKVCFCIEVSCSVQKNEEGSLMACQHDIERLLRASGCYSLVWLKKESLLWHPDRFGQKCHPDYRTVLCKKATEMFTIFGALIDSERNSRTSI